MVHSRRTLVWVNGPLQRPDVCSGPLTHPGRALSAPLDCRPGSIRP
ncbi:hypothetical protein NY08_4953 [Rhodococcus sp. B7740]|nr:hypothetical protein NY08_4953 [Rhodococcus sp. B7740]